TPDVSRGLPGWAAWEPRDVSICERWIGRLPCGERSRSRRDRCPEVQEQRFSVQWAAYSARTYVRVWVGRRAEQTRPLIDRLRSKIVRPGVLAQRESSGLQSRRFQVRILGAPFPGRFLTWL